MVYTREKFWKSQGKATNGVQISASDLIILIRECVSPIQRTYPHLKFCLDILELVINIHHYILTCVV
jgi:hypothetical protein